MAIVLDGKVCSAPIIRGKIPGGVAVLAGVYTEREAKNLALILRCGALATPLRLLPEFPGATPTR